MTMGDPAAERFLSYSAPDDSVIWKIMFLDSGCLVGELHRPAEGRTSYFALDTRNGSLVMNDFAPEPAIVAEESASLLRTGLFTTAKSLFYLHSYVDEGPEHMGIWAVDPLKGSVVWQRQDLSLVCNLGHALLAYRAGSFAGFPERCYFLLDPMSGRVIQTPGEDASLVNALRAEAPIEEDRQGIRLPLFYHQSDECNMSVEGLAVLRRIAGRGLCEYIFRDNVLAAAVHRPDSATGSPAFTTDLELWCSGQQLYSDRVCEANPAPCMNYFLLKDVSLYYIKKRTELAGVRFNAACGGV